jgi:hypothetical protein
MEAGIFCHKNFYKVERNVSREYIVDRTLAQKNPQLVSIKLYQSN